MNTCAKCGAQQTAQPTRVLEYETTVLDVPVVLLNTVENYTYECGHTATLIVNQEGLFSAVALCRIQMPVKLNGREIRLLRKAMGLKATQLSKLIGVKAETLSRWENEKEVISNLPEKQFRLAVVLALEEKARAIDVDLNELMSLEITPVRPANWNPIYLERVVFKEEKRKTRMWDKAEPTLDVAA